MRYCLKLSKTVLKHDNKKEARGRGVIMSPWGAGRNIFLFSIVALVPVLKKSKPGLAPLYFAKFVKALKKINACAVVAL